jgi:hypothetical protein
MYSVKISFTDSTAHALMAKKSILRCVKTVYSKIIFFQNTLDMQIQFESMPFLTNHANVITVISPFNVLPGKQWI